MGFKRIAAVVAGIAVAATGTVAIVDPPLIIGQGPVVTGGTTPAASHLWMATNGTINCVRNASPVSLTVALANNNVCSTVTAACAAYQANDTVVIAAGMYTTGFTETCSNITFTTVPGAFADFESFGSISGTNVTLTGDTVGYGVGFSLGIMSLTGTNIVWNDVNLYCKTLAGSAWAQLHQSNSGEDACNSNIAISATGFTWNGGDQEQWAVCLANCTHTNTPSNANPNDDFVNPLASNVLIENVVFKNYWGMDPGGLTPPLHSEEWFLNGGTNITFQNDQAYDCGPPVALGYPVNTSCNSAWMFVGATGTNNESDFVSLIQDIIAPTSSVNGATHTAFQWGHEKPAGHEYTFTDAYSTLDGTLTLCGVSANKCDGSQITGANIAISGTVAQQGSVSCFPSGSYSHNTFFNTGNAASCSVTDQHFNATPSSTFWTAPGAPSYTYTPLAVIQGKGENTVCATLPNGHDIFGTTRPVFPTACDDGAVQH